MRIYYISDIHVDRKDVDPYKYLDSLLPEDGYYSSSILVVAGDISASLRETASLLGYISSKFYKVIFVLGNHEFRGDGLGFFNPEVYEDSLKTMLLGYKDVIVLANEEVTLDGLRIVGSSNWYELPDNYSRAWWSTFSKDYGYAHKDYKSSNKHSLRDTNYLESIEGHIDLLVTHVPPCYLPRSPYEDNLAYYKDVNIKADYWICGHQHNVEDMTWKESRLLCNPVGYKGENTGYSVRYIEIEKG